MRCLLVVAAFCLIAAPAFASPELLPVKGTHYATYRMATGELTPTPGPQRYGPVVWSATYDTGWYIGIYGDGVVLLDWGDVGDVDSPVVIDGFQFAFATEMVLPDRLDCIMWFYGEENGINSYAHVPLAGFRITDLPTGDPHIPQAWNGWFVTIDLEGSGDEFAMSGSDLDADGLVDFGYTYWFMGPPVGDRTGPHIAGDPNELLRPPGAEDVFDTYFTDDPNQGTADVYEGSWWYSSDPFAQHYLELYGGGNIPETWCPQPGPDGKYCWADIAPDPHDCIVGLGDLAQLLSNYGMTTGATHLMGDIQPLNVGDGDVDLADLAEMLSEYGNNCN